MDEKNLIISNSNEELNEIRQFTGESQMAITKIPYLHFNGKPDSGDFGIISGKGQEKNEQILGKEIEVVIVKARFQYQSKMGAKQDLYSSEVDNQNANVDIYESGVREPLESLPYKTVKEKYPDLKANIILYVFFQDKLWKLRVNGTAFGNFFDYAGSFRNDTFLKYYTKISSEKAVNDSGLPYQKMTFSKGELYPDWQLIWSTLKDLSENLKSTAQKRAEEGLLDSPKEDLPEIQIEDVDMSDIKAEEIPF
jgi:hypothetical protein